MMKNIFNSKRKGFLLNVKIILVGKLGYAFTRVSEYLFID